MMYESDCEDAEFDRAVAELRDFIVAASTKALETAAATTMSSSATQTELGNEDGGRRCVALPCICTKCKEKRRRRKEKKEILRCVVSEKEDESKRLRAELAAEKKASSSLLNDVRMVQEKICALGAEVKRVKKRFEETEQECEVAKKKFLLEKAASDDVIQGLEDTIRKKDERIAFLEESLNETLSSLASATNFAQVLKGV